MNRRGEVFFRLLARHRAIVLLIHAGLVVAALFGASRVQVDYSAEQFFVFEGEDRDVFDEFKEHFPREDLQVSAFLEVSGPLGIEEYRTLEGLAEAFRDAGLDPVRWLGEADLVEETVEGGQPAVRFIRLADEMELSEARLRELVEARRDHPLFAGTLWNNDLTVFAVHGYLDPAENNDPGRREITAQLQADIEKLSEGSGRIVLNGLPILRVTIPLALEADMGKLLGIGFLVSFVVLLAYFQRLSLVLLCFAGVAPAIFLTLGVMGFTGHSVSVLTSAMPIVVLVVALSDATHLVVHTRRRWHDGLSVPEAVADTFSSLARTCFFTSLTTALGFVGLVATRNRLVGEFGVVTAIAVIVAYCVTMTLLPVLLTFAKNLGPEETLAERLSVGVVQRVEAALRMRPVWLTSAFAICLGVGLVLGAGLRVEAFLIDDLKPGDPILDELRWIEDAGYGVFQVNVFIKTDDVQGHSPEVLQWTEDLQSFADSDPIVIGSLGLPQFVRELGVAYGSAPEADVANPVGALPFAAQWRTEEVAELLFLSELQGQDALEEVYLRDEGVGQVILFVRDEGSSRLSPFLGRLEDRLAEQPPPGGSATVTGTVRLSQVLWDQMVSKFLPGVISSIFLVWMALAWMFRSGRLGVLALIPNLVPLAMLLGLMRLGGFNLKPSTIIVFAIAFGIVADDTIHFLGALARNLRESSEVDTALAHAVREVGPALIVVTVVVCAGFTVLTVSRFQVLFLIGFLTAAASLLAVAADLLGFPALLRVVARRPALHSLLTGRVP